VYAVVNGGDIYKQTGGTGSFVNVSSALGTKGWFSITSTPSGDVYAVVNGGDIYRQIGGTGSFVARGAGNKDWGAITSTPSGNVYVVIYAGGDIYKSIPDGTSTPITRIFSSAVATVRDFTTEAGHNNWIVVAQGVVVDLTNAVYNVATNIFKAFAGGWFIPNPTINGGAHVVPLISVSTSTLAYTGASDTKTIKWKPVIDWDTATTCLYSYDDFVTTSVVTCSASDTTLPRPTAGPHTLSLRGTDANGGMAEASLTYYYDNTSPLGIDSSDATLPLDEVTRPYYYLSSDISFPLTFAVSAELRGSAATTVISTTGGYTTSGAIDAQGYNLVLRNITVGGAITSNGFSSGASGGSISIYNANTASITANGAAGTNGGAGGVVTIATSTTAAVTANGANGTTNGGAGGSVTITNSIGNPLTSTVTASGGSSSSCGDGGDSGDIVLTNSSYGTLTSDAGSAATSGCPGQSHSSGTQHHAPTVTGVHSSQVVSSNSSPVVRSSTGTVNAAVQEFRRATATTLPTLSLPTLVVGRLPTLTSLPTFGGTGIRSFSFAGPIAKFLFEPLPEGLRSTLATSPVLAAYVSSKGIAGAQSLSRLVVTPIAITDPAPIGLYSVSRGGRTLSTSLSSDGLTLFQLVHVSPGAELSVSREGSSLSSGMFARKPLQFDVDGSAALRAPALPGTYFLTSSSSPLSLAVQVGVSAISALPEAKPPSIWQRVWGWFGFR